MSFIYFLQRQVPPSSKDKYEKAWKDIVVQLQKRTPAPKSIYQKLINEGRPIPMDTPNELVYLDFKKYAYKNRSMFKKELLKNKDNSGKMFLTLSALWYKWARKDNKEFTHIKDKLKFGRALMIMMVKDDVVFSKEAWKKTNQITNLKEDLGLNEAIPQNFHQGRVSDYHTALRGKKKDYSGGTNFKKKNHGQPDIDTDDEDQETNQLSNQQLHVKAKLKVAESGKDKSKKNYKDWKNTNEDLDNLSSTERIELYKLYSRAMKAMPGSPNQKKIKVLINKLRKKADLKSLPENTPNSSKPYILDDESILKGTPEDKDAIDRDIDETVDKDDLKNAKFRLKKVLKYLDIEYKKTRRGEKYVQINYIPITRPQSQNPEFVNVRYEDEKDLQNIGKALKLKLKESVSEVAERDYKDEYKKFQSSTKSKKYRAELNKYNRDKGTYGNGDGKDASHKGGKIVGFESASKNRGRAEKSRLKKK